MRNEYLPLYRRTGGEAARLHEEALWEPSFRENVACARAIEKALREYYNNDDSISPDCASKVLDEFGFKRVSFVLAYTVRDHETLPVQMFDGETRKWAHGFEIVTDKQYGHYFCVDTATVLLERFIRQTRDAYQSLCLFNRSHCTCGMYDKDVKGNVLVMKPDTLKESYWSQENQLWLAEDGFGCDPSSSGRAIYATCLGDGERTRWNREDFIGVLDKQYLPEWAAEKLEALQTQKQSSALKMGSMELR